MLRRDTHLLLCLTKGYALTEISECQSNRCLVEHCDDGDWVDTKCDEVEAVGSMAVDLQITPLRYGVITNAT